MGRYKEPKRSVEEISAIGLLQLSNSFRLQEERDGLSPRSAKCKISNMNLSNFKAVMLAPPRSLEKEWGPQHKDAQSRVREAVARTLKHLVGKPAVEEKALAATMGLLDAGAMQTARCEGYAKFPAQREQAP